MPSLRVLLVEDHPVIRMTVSSLLSTHCVLVGTVDRGDEVLAAVDKLQPDVVVLDISLPGQSGLEVLPELREIHPEIGVVMLTSHDEPECIESAFRNGADDYVLKRQATERLWPAVRNAGNMRSSCAA